MIRLKNNWILLLLLCYNLNLTASIENSIFCRSRILYESIDGKHISTLGEENKDLKTLINDLAYKDETYCFNTTTIAILKGPTNLKIADDLYNRSTESPHIRIEYLSPLYTLTIRNQNNVIENKLTFGGNKKFTLLTLANKNATPTEIKKFWQEQKRYTFEQLENELNQYHEAQLFLKEMIKKYPLDYLPSEFLVSSQVVIQTTAPNPNYNPVYEIPENAEGHLLDFEKTIPLDLKKGDELTFIAKGEIINGPDHFSPNGFPDRFPRSYQKKFNNQRYGKVMVSIGENIYEVGKGATIRVEQPGELKLLTNMKNKNFKAKGRFETWIFLNKKLISPIENTGYISMLNNTSIQDKFYFTPDNKLVACVNKNKVVRILGLENGKELKKYQNLEADILNLIFLEYDPVFVTVDKNGNIVFREVVSGKILKKLFLSKKKLDQTSFSKNGDFLAATLELPLETLMKQQNEDQAFMVYDLNKELIQQGKDGKKMITLHTKPISLVAFSPFQDLLLSGDLSGRIILWNTKTWQPIIDTEIKNQQINNVIFDQFSSSAWIETHTYTQAPAYVGGSTAIRNIHSHRLDLKTGSFLKIGPSDFSDVNYDPKIRTGDTFVSFSSDREFMIIANRKGEIQLWETKNY